MTQRQRQIVLLLRTLTDFDFQPLNSTSALVQKQALRGEGPSMKVDCPDCSGEGERRIRGVLRPCESCGARGKIVVDAYTHRKVGTLETDLVQRTRWVKCDSCGGPRPGLAPGMYGNEQACPYCADSGRPGYVRAPERPIRPWRSVPVPLRADAPELGRGDPVIACMERRQIAGSYEELGLALGTLRLQYRLVYRLVVRVYVEAEFEEEEASERQRGLLDRGLTYLAELMPEEIRVPTWAERFERRRRERVIAEKAAA